MSATLDMPLFEAASPAAAAAPLQTVGTSASSSNKSPEKEREDKLLNAKKKLKSYRARQSKANNSISPSSPSSSPSRAGNKLSSAGSSSFSTAAKRSSYIAPRQSLQGASSISSTSTGNAGGGKIAHGHAHRRSHSRNLSISTGHSANMGFLLSSTMSPQEREKREARRSSLIFGKVDPAAVAAACAANAATSAASSSTSPLASTASTPTQSTTKSNATTPTQSSIPLTSSQATASTQPAMATATSATAINDYHANRRNSRRHSRTSSISISIAPSTFDGFAAVSPSGTSSNNNLVSPRRLSYGAQLPSSSTSSSSSMSMSPSPASRSPKTSSSAHNTPSTFPTSSSSPSLSSTLASFTLGGGPSSQSNTARFNMMNNSPMQPTTASQHQKILNRQSVPAFATAAQTTLQNGRMVLSAQTGGSGISPQTSPQPPQHAFPGAAAGFAGPAFGGVSGASSGGMLNPASAAAGWNRRASLGVPKSPSFFESQQLAISHSEQGSSSSTPTNSSSSSSSTSNNASQQHARKNSRHSRRISVSTRRESMEIMAGLIPGLIHNNPSSPAMQGDSAVMDRLASISNGSSTTSSSTNGYDMTVLGSSLAMEERQYSSEEEERDFALSRLEGRLAVRPDMIQLPDESTTSTSASSSMMNSGSNGDANPGGQQARLLSSTRSEKRNSWNPRDSWGTTGPFATTTSTGYNGAKSGNLDMLVEEEEEEEEEEEQAEEETETEREEESIQDVSTITEDENDVSASDEPAPSMTTAGKRSRPGTLTIAPRKLSLSSVSSEEKVVSPPATASVTHSSVKIGGQQRLPPRPLSLISSSSMGNLSGISSTSDVKSARRQSGLRSLTLTSPEHILNGPGSATSPAGSGTSSSGVMARRRLSLLNNAVSPSPIASPTPSSNGGGIRPFSISSTSSILSPDASLRSNFQFGSSTKEAQLQSQQHQQQAGSSGLLVNGLPRPRKSYSNASNASSAISTPSRTAGSSAPPTGRPSLNYNNNAGGASASAGRFGGGRRFSDLASPSSAGFGELVMEESLMEEDEDELEEDEESALQHEKILDGLNRDEEEESTQKLGRLSPEAPEMSHADSSITNVSVSDDPVILDLQVRALKSQVEHLRAQLSTSDSARKEEVESLRFELAEVKENMLNAEEEREMLREDIDGWRTRCADLERALQNERAKLDDEKREGMLLRDKVRKLGDRLAQNQNGPAASSTEGGDTSSPDGTIDASLVNAQAKLIGEMRDQIFSLAAALERERMRNAGETEQDPSRSSSPLLRALASQDETIAASLKKEEEAAEIAEKLNRVPQHHNTSTQSSAASGSYNFSSSFSSFHSQMGNNTEDTSVGDDNDSMYGSKSPSSPAFWASSPTPSYSQMSNNANGSNGISIHSSSTPLRNSDLCMNFGGLQTLAEEDEEEEMEDDDFNGAIAEVNAQAKKALSMSDLSEEEENDAVPELVHDEALSQRRADFEALRARTQSASTGSSMDTNDRMPLTPAKEHGSPNLGAQPSKPSHNRSDSFIKQWSFPKGPVEPLDLTEHHHNDSFWALYQGSLPALPLSESLVEAPPFSAEITLDEEYFHMAREKPLPASRPSSTISIPSRPPISRSNSQLSRLNEKLESPAVHLNPSPASGSRISLQGFSSLWGNYMRGPQTPPAPESTTSSSFSTAAPAKSVAPVHAQVNAKPAAQNAPLAGRKPLLRLQPSPLGNLNFAHTSACCAANTNGHSHRILHL